MFQTTARVLLLAAAPVAALAANFNGTWDGTIMAGTVPVAFRMEVTENPAKICFFEGNQPMCSTSAEVRDGKLIARWDYLKTELTLDSKDKALAGVYHNYRSNRDYSVEARAHRGLRTGPAARRSLFLEAAQLGHPRHLLCFALDEASELLGSAADGVDALGTQRLHDVLGLERFVGDA